MSSPNPSSYHKWYGTKLTVNHTVIGLSEQSESPEHHMKVALSVDHLGVGEMDLPVWLVPRIGVGPRHVLFWGNTDLYVFNRDTHLLEAFPQDDQVNEAYPIGHLWCLVRELSVVVIDPDLLVMNQTVFDHNEVIMASWWNGDQLIVEDFEGRQYAFVLSADASTLRQVDIT